MDRRVADDAVVRPPRPASNWGFTRATIGAAAGPSAATTGAQHEPQRDERHVDDGQVDRLREASSRVSVRAFVRSIDTTRASRRSDSASWPRPTSSA